MVQNVISVQSTIIRTRLAKITALLVHSVKKRVVWAPTVLHNVLVSIKNTDSIFCMLLIDYMILYVISSFWGGHCQSNLY